MSISFGSTLKVYLKLTILFALLGGILVGLGFLIGGVSLAFWFLIFALAFNFLMYFVSDKIVLLSTGARIVSEEEAPRLHAIVSKLAAQAGIPKPKVAIVSSPQPNAFATGRNKEHALVAATTGLLNMMNDDEVEAVLAHEIGHVIHRDMLVSTVAASIATAISYIGNLIAWMAILGGLGGRDRDSGARSIAALGAAILAPLAATFVQLAISRSREYYADEASAVLTRRPQSLIRALTKIEQMIYRGIPLNASPSTASLWIANPFKGSSLLELFSTHPSTENRIKRLEEIARKMGYYV
ncbi:MAG: M48 family metalloprotease [Nitrososphaeria archaeon]|nr:M48 family metalloprotease [Nitrososphaeria archaeon]